MNGEEISAFVDRLESGKALVTDFHELSSSDWDEVKKLFEARREYNMQRYVNALFAYRIKYDLERQEAKRTYSEQEILSEFESRE